MTTDTTTSKIVAQRMNELGFGEITQPVVEPARKRTRREPAALVTPTWGKDDAMTEELLDMMADDLREVFMDTAEAAGFVSRNKESAGDLRGMARWLMKMHFVRK